MSPKELVELLADKEDFTYQVISEEEYSTKAYLIIKKFSPYCQEGDEHYKITVEKL
tara:strand:+ start:128 stop:295 length:168 start_codon:yes stop_codon:yes gene_type:complete